MKKLAIFDLDHTILSIDSLFVFISFIFKKNKIKIIYLPFLIFMTILKLFGIISIETFKSSWLIIIKNIQPELLESYSKEFVEKKLIPKLKNNAVAEINNLKKKGFTLILATASFEFYVKYLSEYLNFDHFFGTRVIITAEDKQIIISGKNCKGDEKINRILEFVNIDEIIKSESIGYSDSKTDLFFLKLVNKFYLVTKKKWKIIREYQ